MNVKVNLFVGIKDSWGTIERISFREGTSGELPSPRLSLIASGALGIAGEYTLKNLPLLLRCLPISSPGAIDGKTETDSQMTRSLDSLLSNKQPSLLLFPEILPAAAVQDSGVAIEYFSPEKPQLRTGNGEHSCDSVGLAFFLPTNPGQSWGPFDRVPILMRRSIWEWGCYVWIW